MFEYKINKKCPSTKARLGEFKTPHGLIKTPCFMPVGTKASVKTLTNDDLNNLDAEIILANTYHLELRPGSKLIAQMGGLHKWMNWNKPMLTDSGGFQVFSLGEGQRFKKTKEKLIKITEDGVFFRSHIDGSKKFLSPEDVMEIEHNLGADIIMAFDECTPADCNKEYALQAMKRTHRWLDRCIDYHNKKGDLNKQALFGIIQGGMFDDLREESTKYICSKNLPGIAIGGLSVGEDKETMYKTIDNVVPFLPEEKVRYLMGVGDPIDLVEAVTRGIDIFDCVLPTRLGRHGTALTETGKMNLLNSQYKTDGAPISIDCNCETCRNHSKSYIHHLIKEKEITGLKLITIHNIHFLINLIKALRKAISTNTMDDFVNKTRENLTR